VIKLKKKAETPPPLVASSAVPAFTPIEPNKPLMPPVQTDILTGKARAVMMSEYAKRLEVYTVPGFSAVLDSDTAAKLTDRLTALRKGHTMPEIRRWKDAWVHNRIRAVSFAEHKGDTRESFSAAMYGHMFDGKALPGEVKMKPLVTDYIEWDTAKYYIRVRKEAWERKRARIIEYPTRKAPKKNPAKWASRAEADMIKFVTVKMRLKKGMFHTEPEFNAYRKLLMASMFSDLPQILDGAQKKLEV
jgi:hypothetical protein